MEKSRRPLAHAGIKKRRRYQRRAEKSVREFHGCRKKTDRERFPKGPDDKHDHHRYWLCRRHPQLRRRGLPFRPPQPEAEDADRKSTRLDSSHANISYAV